MIDIILISVALIVLLVGSFTDFKTREVPDWVNYSAIVAGIGLRLLYSASTYDWGYLYRGLLGFGVFFVLALAMFYLGQWGGGDSKMLMGLGAIIGLDIAKNSLLFAFIVNVLLVGAVYGMVWGIVLAIKHRKKFISYVEKRIKSKQHKAAKRYMLLIIAVLVIISFAVDLWIAVLLIGIAIGAVVMFYCILFFQAVEKTSMIKLLPVGMLTEGDWIVKDVIVKNKKICGPKDLGISLEQIKQLKKLNVKKVLVKEGMPFVPVFLISFVVSLIWGNIVLLFV